MATPEEFIEAIIQNALATAAESTDAAADAAEDLIRQKAGLYLPPPDPNNQFVVTAVEPAIPDVSDTLLSYDSQFAYLVKLLGAELAKFLNTYFPTTSAAFDAANAWLVDTITNGGTGINPDVENQIWQRARENVIVEGARVNAQILSGYASKGYMVHSGAMDKKLEEVQLAQIAASGKIATDQAAKAMEIEIETIKFAVTEALASRHKAIQAAIDYIRALVSLPDTAIKYVLMQSDAKAKMMAAAADFYRARMTRDEITLRSRLAEKQQEMETYTHRRTNATQNDQVNVQALGSAADVYGKSAQAALSSLNSVATTAVNAFQ